MDKKTVIISPVTRIEGHAKISISLDASGEVAGARFHVDEFRGFEKFCEGRLYTEMPVITPRICGICPASHTIASVKACEMIQGIKPTYTGDLLRRLMLLGQNVASHALSFFYLSVPDMLLGFDAAPAERNIIGLAQTNPEFARRGIRLRQFGQEISERITGEKIHSAGIVPGGMAFPLTMENRNYLLNRVGEATETTLMALEILKTFIQHNQEMVNSFAPAPTLYLGTVDTQGAHELYDGNLRMVNKDGTILQDQCSPAKYLDYIAERSIDFSYLKNPYYKPLGMEQGIYRVGPLARLNVASKMKTAKAQQEFEIFRKLGNGTPVHGTFYYHYARLIETLASIEEIACILHDEEVTSEHLRHHGYWNYVTGIGCAEAPRGTLFHHYQTDPSGKLTRVNLLIATGQNNPSMNQSVLDVARQYIKGPDIKEGMLNRVESAIRCYDPCLSCSTHALGNMPFIVEIKDVSGALIKTIVR